MVTAESVTIKVPVGMSKYLVTMNPETELTRNALLLYCLLYTSPSPRD